jgi:hypothetical protein
MGVARLRLGPASDVDTAATACLPVAPIATALKPFMLVLRATYRCAVESASDARCKRAAELGLTGRPEAETLDDVMNEAKRCGPDVAVLPSRLKVGDSDVIASVVLLPAETVCEAVGLALVLPLLASS